MVLSSDRWQRLESLFYAALPLPRSARGAFIEEHCGGDEALRKEVESLLVSADQPLENFENPIREAAEQMLADSVLPELRSGDRFARYEVVSPIGAGGMGRAERQSSIRRDGYRSGCQQDAKRREHGRQRGAVRDSEFRTLGDSHYRYFVRRGQFDA